MGTLPVISIESRIPFSSPGYSLGKYYGIDMHIVHAIEMSDRTTIAEFFSHCCSEAKIDVLMGAECCLKHKTYPHQDKIAFYNWMMTLMTPLEIKAAQ
jgi:hypothetical protein